MTDVFDKAKRSEIMSKVKNKNTKPELIIRGIFRELGYGYRLRNKSLPCNPDIIFKGRKKAIFINGCFWHGHDCKRGALPVSNKERWLNKINNNVERDNNNYKTLSALGWTYLVIWQCEIKKRDIKALTKRILDFMES